MLTHALLHCHVECRHCMPPVLASSNTGTWMHSITLHCLLACMELKRICMAWPGTATNSMEGTQTASCVRHALHRLQHCFWVLKWLYMRVCVCDRWQSPSMQHYRSSVMLALSWCPSTPLHSKSWQLALGLVQQLTPSTTWMPLRPMNLSLYLAGKPLLYC